VTCVSPFRFHYCTVLSSLSSLRTSPYCLCLCLCVLFISLFPAQEFFFPTSQNSYLIPAHLSRKVLFFHDHLIFSVHPPGSNRVLTHSLPSFFPLSLSKIHKPNPQSFETPYPMQIPIHSHLPRYSIPPLTPRPPTSFPVLCIHAMPTSLFPTKHTPKNPPRNANSDQEQENNSPSIFLPIHQ
jgi:hypothetical protein